MDWERFKEEPGWRSIQQLLDDRIAIIQAEIEQPDSTPTLIQLRILQQELMDIRFFLTIPDLFIQTPDKDLANVVDSSS